VVVLGERLRVVQWAALALAAVAVLELTLEYGHLPYVSLALAFSFGTYGLMKKKANVRALEGLALETILLTPIALIYLGALQANDDLVFGHHGWLNVALLLSTGLATAVPLLMFAGAATRVTLTTLGLLQYITPTTQFILGIVVFHEEMTVARWVGFILIWAALAIITSEAISNRRRVLRRAAENVAC
ncbi:MAG: EamA family transporter, partial [Nocardioidaceae bacterium]